MNEFTIKGEFCEFKEDSSSQKVKFINEKKDRVMVLHIENFTKPLYQVFPK